MHFLGLSIRGDDLYHPSFLAKKKLTGTKGACERKNAYKINVNLMQYAIEKKLI